MYKTGQAVIHFVIATGEALGLSFVEKEQTRTLLTTDFNGNRSGQSKTASRPATQAEILAEAQRHGWVLYMDDYLTSPNENITVNKKTEYLWGYSISSTLPIKNLTVFGNECIIAHRPITALKLCEI